MRRSPCFSCCSRTENCHATCSTYIEWTVQRRSVIESLRMQYCAVRDYRYDRSTALLRQAAVRRRYK